MSPLGGSAGRPLDPPRLLALARQMLTGVGDAHLGEWDEIGDIACHVRRRLSDAEMRTVGEVRDLRGMTEAGSRLWRAKQWLPPAMWTMAEEEVSALS